MNIFALLTTLLPSLINVAQATQKPGPTKLNMVLTMAQQIAAILQTVMAPQLVPSRAELTPHVELTLAQMKAAKTLVAMPPARPEPVPLPHAG